MAHESPRRRVVAVEVLVCAVLLVAIAFFAMWKMDYLTPGHLHQLRMTDNSRSAYVAKNLVEGKGYTTSELPAFMVDFYDHQHKLDRTDWPNADRFPFTTCAIAALYFVTGSTSWQVGIVGYNFLCFILLYALLYWLARTVWNDRWAALGTLGLALLHPLAYVYPLFMKDADMLALTTGVMAAAYRYYTRPDDRMSWKLAVVWGTLLGWLFLDRPNVGGALALYVAGIAVRRLWRLRREQGGIAALREVLRGEGLVLIVVGLWAIPFAIYSISEWGSPFFTANAMYQMPLGTRFAMETDTWYKYSEPGKAITLATLAHGAPVQLLTKFTSSWVRTLKVVVRSFAGDLALALGLLAWFSRKSPGGSDTPEARSERAVYLVARMVGFAVLCNFLVLPLYGYQNYPYRSYLAFFTPLVWLLGGRAIVLLVQLARPSASRAFAWLREHRGAVVLVAIVASLAWNLTARSDDESEVFTRLCRFVGSHWLSSSILLGLLLWGRWLKRLPRFPVAAVSVLVFSMVRFTPYRTMKRYNLGWFPADESVWDVLRQRDGLVMSFALQGEVNWVSGRRNIPAPENVMHVYSLLFDHRLEVQDLYIESAAAMIGPEDGPFYTAAPGFESYARMERFQAPLPGYEIVFHSATQLAYRKFGVKRPLPKASTVYRLVDPSAVQAMRHSPTVLELGRVEQAVYTTYGWGSYFTVDGRPAVAATDAARRRYTGDPEGLKPGEDTATSFFLDERRPDSIDLDVYGIAATKLELFWNLDLYAYDRPEDRRAHAIGTYTLTHPGWQTIHVVIPRGLTRAGLNKLGFRSSSLTAVTMCPSSYTDAACAALKEHPTDTATPLVVHADGLGAPEAMHASLLVGTLSFHYAAEPATHVAP